MPEITFPTEWLKARVNVQHGDYIRFLDTGTQDKDSRWVFQVGIIAQARPGVVVESKKFSLNKTNFDEVARMYGTNSDKWKDKEMRVSVVKVRNQKGILVPSVRLVSPSLEVGANDANEEEDEIDVNE